MFAGNRLTQQIHGNLDALAAGEDVDDKQVTERFFGLAGAPVASYCGDKQAFLGRYHSYGDPQGVAAGDLGNVDGYQPDCQRPGAARRLHPGRAADPRNRGLPDSVTRSRRPRWIGLRPVHF